MNHRWERIMTNFRNLLQATALAGVVTLAPQSIAQAQEAAKLLINCVGGAAEAVIVRTKNSPDTLLDTAPARALDNSQINAGASTGNADTYILTLSGEADNNTAAGSFTVQGQIRIDEGAWTNIHPNGPNTFHQGTNATTASMTWCIRVEASVSAALRIVWNSIGAGNTATLDDYTVMVQRLN
jgi:hypothetical protein